MNPLVKNTMWADASVRKGVEVKLEIMTLKFNIQTQHVTKVNITQVSQPDAISCDATVCYYAEKINYQRGIFTFSHFRGVFRA